MYCTVFSNNTKIRPLQNGWGNRKSVEKEKKKVDFAVETVYQPGTTGLLLNRHRDNLKKVWTERGWREEMYRTFTSKTNKEGVQKCHVVQSLKKVTGKISVISKLFINTGRLCSHYCCSENFLDHGCLLETRDQCSSEVREAHGLRTEQRTKPRDICVWFYNSMRCLHPDFHMQSYWKGYSRKIMVKDSQRYCPPSKWRGNSQSLFHIVQGLRDTHKQDQSEGVTLQKETSFLLNTL